MKKELLRINQLNFDYAPTRKLENVSLCILQGECTGLLGLTYSGKDSLTKFLLGDYRTDADLNSILIEGKHARGWEQLESFIYRIHKSNYIIEEWTVAEYLCLVLSKRHSLFLHREALELEARECLNELELDIDVSERMSSLSEMERRIVDLAKAYRLGAKVVIIEDEFEGMSYEDILKFSKVMHRLIDKRMGVMVSSHSNYVLTSLSDKYIIFNHGKIVKKCSTKSLRPEDMNIYLLGKSNLSAGEPAPYARVTAEENDVVYRVRNLHLNGDKLYNFDFKKGEIVTLLALNRKTKEQIFLALAGREGTGNLHYVIGGRRYDVVDYYALSKERIVSVMLLGSHDEIFDSMSVGENLVLPSLKKLSFLDYIKNSAGIQKLTLSQKPEKREGKAGELRVNDLIRLTLERWYIFNPRVLVLYEPFALCDANGVNVVKDYVKKFSDKGTVVIIVNAREEYIEDISDRIIHVE